MLPGQCKALNVAEPTVIGFADNRQVEELGGAVAYGQCTYGVAHHADLIGVGDADRRTQRTLLGDPWQTRHFAIAIV
jgi:hypothetical protein